MRDRAGQRLRGRYTQLDDITMMAVVLVPPDLTYRTLQSDLQTVADDLNVDIDVSPYKG